MTDQTERQTDSERDREAERMRDTQRDKTDDHETVHISLRPSTPQPPLKGVAQQLISHLTGVLHPG